MLKLVRFAAAAAFVVVLFAACGAEPSLFLNRNGSGRFDLTLRLAQPFVDYLLDLGEAAGTLTSREEAALFDLKTISQKLSRYPGVKILNLKTTPAGELSLSLSFRDVSVFAAPGDLWPKGSPLAWQAGPPRTLRLKLDQAMMKRILTAFFRFEATELESFLPRAGESRADYDENLDFALDGGSTLFRDSVITFQVQVEGVIDDHNGTLKNKNTVTFTVPLGAVLFMEKSLDYFVTYR